MMKARILWLVQGDRSTAFYHTSALERRSRNRILCFKDRLGNWIDGDRGIAAFIRERVLDLFTTSLSTSPCMLWTPPCWQVCLKEDEAGNLARLVTDEEIKVGLWALKPFKAPGSDGLHADFFQRFWFLVRESLKAEIKNIFLHRGGADLSQ